MSYQLVFWKQSSVADGDAQPVYERLSETGVTSAGLEAFNALRAKKSGKKAEW